MELPATGHSLVQFMANIWDGECTPVDRGVYVSCHQEYDKYHNAIKTARLCGAQFLWSVTNTQERVFQLPNGDRVATNRDGSSIRPVRKHNA